MPVRRRTLFAWSFRVLAYLLSLTNGVRFFCAREQKHRRMKEREMNDQDNARVNAAFAKGCESFTESQLDEVLSDEKLAHKKAAKLGNFFEEFIPLLQMIKDYHAGAYSDVPWKFIAAAGFAIFYLLNPFDVLPDVLPIIGYLDDAAVFGLVVSSFKSEIERYKEWKRLFDENAKGEISENIRRGKMHS